MLVLMNIELIENFSWFLIDQPSWNVYEVALMATGDISLDFACIQGSSLYVWSKEGGYWRTCRVGTAQGSWARENYTCCQSQWRFQLLLGLQKVWVLMFVSTDVGIFMIKLNPWQLKKVYEPGFYLSVLPYISLYAPGTILTLACLFSCIFLYNFWMLSMQFCVC